MKVIRLPRSKVQVGVALPWSVRDESGILLLSAGHVVESEHQLEALLSRGAFVDMEEVRATSKLVSTSQSALTAGRPAVERKVNLFDLWSRAPIELRDVLTRHATTPGLQAALDTYAQGLVQLVDKNVDIAVYGCIRQENTQAFYYGYAHAVHTAALSLLLARNLQWTPARSMSLFKAALTMNLVIHDLQGQMSTQTEPVTVRQREAIAQHPMQALAALRAAGVDDPDWLDAIAQHHERLDGSGYPGTATPGELAVALRVLDVFLARISPRSIRPPLSVQDAARQLYHEDSGGPLSVALIKELGMYPPGEFVRLKCGELAVVVQRRAHVRMPQVASITDARAKPVSSTVRRETSEPEFAIVEVVADKKMLLRLPPERLYGYANAEA